MGTNRGIVSTSLVRASTTGPFYSRDPAVRLPGFRGIATTAEFALDFVSDIVSEDVCRQVLYVSVSAGILGRIVAL